MRIQQLIARPGRDDGAIALIVAVCAVLLLGMAAFAVDFGNAFANKRQLSVAADASALAAARAVNAQIPVGEYLQRCRTAVHSAIRGRAGQRSERPTNDSVVTSVDVACVSGTVEVTVNNQRSVPSFFGGVFGANGYTPAGTATAQLFVPAAVSGLRPIAACQATVLANYIPDASPPVANAFLVNVSNNSAVCGGGAPGQWGFTNFLDQGAFGEFDNSGDPAYNPDPAVCDPPPGSPSAGGSANCQTTWTSDGYGGPVYFPNTTSSPGPGLAGNTGLANQAAFRAAFDDLVGKTIQLPVASQYSGGRLNVTGVVSALVCSVKRGGTDDPGDKRRVRRAADSLCEPGPRDVDRLQEQRRWALGGPRLVRDLRRCRATQRLQYWTGRVRLRHPCGTSLPLGPYLTRPRAPSLGLTFFDESKLTFMVALLPAKLTPSTTIMDANGNQSRHCHEGPESR